MKKPDWDVLPLKRLIARPNVDANRSHSFAIALGLKKTSIVIL